MKSLLLFGVLFVASSSAHRLSKEENRRLQEHCGKPVVPVRIRRSMHTRLASRSEAPWVIYLERTGNWHPNISMEERQTTQECSGSLISSRHVITAAHCINTFYQSVCNADGTVLGGAFPPVNIDALTVKFAETSTVEENGVADFKDFTVGVSKVFYSAKYSSLNCIGKSPDMTDSGDIAVYELSEDVPYSDLIYPACLNDKKLDFGDKLTQFGYGVTGKPGQNSSQIDKLRTVETVVHDCGEMKPAFDSLCDFSKIQSVCSGDSGSGKMVFDARGVASVAAVVSTGTLCHAVLQRQTAGPYKMSPKKNTDVIPHLEWICAATGICVTKEMEETVDEYEKLGYLGENTQWYKTILPLKGNQIYVS